MGIGKTIANLRKAKGMTQADLAAKVYVTRQAVSRWENEESEPSIDMRKLLAGVLGTPVVQLLDLPATPTCQCCGTPFDVPNMPFGTNADGSENPDYCGWCYENGQFTSPDLDSLIERNVPYLQAATGMSAEDAVSFMGALMPTLKRWSTTENVNRSAKATRSKFYVCPDCGNIVWSMGEICCACCGQPLEPLTAQTGDCCAEHMSRVEKSDGCHVVSVAHPMEKKHYISFIAAVGDDLVRIKRLYPQQEAQAIFPIQGPCKFYAYCTEHGMFQITQ